MAVKATIKQSSSIGGIAFPESRSIEGDGQIVQSLAVPAAQGGSLTTRTNDTDGEITMDASDHTVDTGDRVDLYWVGGQRRGVTVGTVTATAVPISGGDGDVLPSQDTDITVALPEEIDIFVDGDNVDAVLAYSAQRGQIVFIDTDTSEVEIAVWNLGVGGVKSWHDEDGDDNPFAAVNIGRAYVSHDLESAAADMRLGIVYNNVAG